MTELPKGLIYGIIGVLLVSGGGVYLLTQEQADVSSTCTITNVTAIFERLSSTGKTGYWTVNGITKQAVCTGGKWIPTNDWLKQNGLTIKDVTITPAEESLYTETGAEIIRIGTVITGSERKVISINNVEYNYSPVIKCICDIPTGCKMTECLK